MNEADRPVPRIGMGGLASGYAWVPQPDITAAELAEAMRQACSEDILFWVNLAIWTYDPRRKPNPKVPMVTYGFQDRAILSP